MTKFKDFSDFLIANDWISGPSLAHLRRVLRTEGLVSSGGQGFASKPLEVSDVTNIFLSLVAADQVKNAPAVVGLYRSATLVSHHSEGCDPWPFGGVSSTANLGEFLDCFFEGLLHNAQNPEWMWTNLNFKFDIVDATIGANASLWFDDGNDTYTPKFSAFNAETYAQIMRGDVDRMIHSSRSIYRYASVGDEFLRPFVGFVIENLFSDERLVEDTSPGKDD